MSAVRLEGDVPQAYFREISLGARHDTSWARPDERDFDVYVCRAPLIPFEEIWQDLRRFI